MEITPEHLGEAGCPFCQSMNSVKALKEYRLLSIRQYLLDAHSNYVITKEIGKTVARVLCASLSACKFYF